MKSFGGALAGCLMGAGLAIYAATRTWSLLVVGRPGLPDLRTASSGADRAPWLVGLALVALAGAGALLATRGVPRRVLGGLLAGAGAGVVAGAVAARAGLDPGRAGPGATFWPVVCGLGGAAILAAGLAAAGQGHRWPVMSSRYERPAAPTGQADLGGGSGPLATAGRGRGEGPDRADEPDRAERPDHEAGSDREAGPDRRDGTGRRGEDSGQPPDQRAAAAPVDTRAVWDALDRGDDPTLR